MSAQKKVLLCSLGLIGRKVCIGLQLKWIKSKKPTREALEPLAGEGIEGKLEEDTEIAEKLSEFFISVFIRGLECSQW